MAQAFRVGQWVSLVGYGSGSGKIVLPESQAERTTADFLARMGRACLLVELKNGSRLHVPVARLARLAGPF